MPQAITTPWKHYALWETLDRENINVLTCIFWFKSANHKATEEMENSFIIKSAESDFNNELDYFQECLQMNAFIFHSLGKALDTLYSTAQLSSNMLLNMRDIS